MHKLLLAIFFLPPFLVYAKSPDAMEDWCNANASRENIGKRAQQHAIYLRVMAVGQVQEYFELFSDKTLDELYNLHRSQSHAGINFLRTQWRGETKADVLDSYMFLMILDDLVKNDIFSMPEASEASWFPPIFRWDESPTLGQFEKSTC